MTLHASPARPLLWCRLWCPPPQYLLQPQAWAPARLEVPMPRGVQACVQAGGAQLCGERGVPGAVPGAYGCALGVGVGVPGAVLGRVVPMDGVPGAAPGGRLHIRLDNLDLLHLCGAPGAVVVGACCPCALHRELRSHVWQGHADTALASAEATAVAASAANTAGGAAAAAAASQRASAEEAALNGLLRGWAFSGWLLCASESLSVPEGALECKVPHSGFLRPSVIGASCWFFGRKDAGVPAIIQEDEGQKRKLQLSPLRFEDALECWRLLCASG
eukprot:scaffold13206_cov23-Tisochrysis_lutea.AAC.2